MGHLVRVTPSASLVVRCMVPARHGPTLSVEQVRPPERRDPSHATYAAERAAILASLERRAVRLAETCNMQHATCTYTVGG